MVAPGVGGGNGSNADLCAQRRGAPPPREQSAQLRGCGGSAGAGAARGPSGAPGRRAGPGAATCGGAGPRGSSGGGFPVWGGTRVPAASAWRARGGANKFGCRRRRAEGAGGGLAGGTRAPSPSQQGAGGRELGRVSLSHLCAQTRCKALREKPLRRPLQATFFCPLFTLHPVPCGRRVLLAMQRAGFPLPAHLWLRDKNFLPLSPVLILVLNLVDGAVATTSYLFQPQKQGVGQKQRN